ncbi:MAG: hypothetical protein M9887_00375 [Chitinophagales bacterium]|nr:hypothetical protein [Chitinophagales bacterium]
MNKNVKNYVYSFPIQLVVVHIKKHPILLLYWIVLTSISANVFAREYGGPYLFLDPEYRGKVSWLSFMMMGFAIGSFIMTWNTCFFMLTSFRFKFIVAFARPFFYFCYNNFIIPFTFNIIYILSIINFHYNQQTPFNEVMIYIVSMIGGQLLVVALVTLYFSLFNKNAEHFLDNLTQKAREKLEVAGVVLKPLKDININRAIHDNSQWPVETFFSGLFRVRTIREVDDFDMAIVKRVLMQHHINTILIIIVSLVIVVVYGALLDNPIFRFPAGAGLILILSIFAAVTTVINYLAGGWQIIVFIAIILGINWISTFNFMVYKHKLLGLDYTQKPYLTYSNTTVDEALTEDILKKDIANTEKILNKWKQKVQKKDQRKPYIIFLQTSGGGMKASYWSMNVLQKLQEATHGKLFDNTFMMTGASGGMIANSFFRQLYFLQKQGQDIDPLDKRFRGDIGKDLLNTIFSGMAANDILFPWQSFEAYHQRYRKDRAYWFDNQLLENTENLLKGKITDFVEAEKNAEIPMLVFSPTIVNDQRSLIISATPVSYLCRPYVGKNRGQLNYLIPDGVEFMRYFKNDGAENMDLTTAIRLNATYPYILPAAYLPTKPEMKIMDAGIKENHGFLMSTRLINVFRDWINNNTAGIIFVQIRADEKLRKTDNMDEKSTFIKELLLPFGSIYSNFAALQDYNDDIMVGELASSLKVPVHILPFIYTPAAENKRASMSYHLTNREKIDIILAYNTQGNQNMERKLKELLRVK